MPCVTNLVYEHLGGGRLVSAAINKLPQPGFRFKLHHDILKSEPFWMRVICQRRSFSSSALVFFFILPFQAGWCYRNQIHARM